MPKRHNFKCRWRMGDSIPCFALRFVQSESAMPPIGEPIQFFNRYTGQVETEQVYGEKPLRWTYESGLGRATLHAIVKRPILSAVYGFLMSRASSKERVLPLSLIHI